MTILLCQVEYVPISDIVFYYTFKSNLENSVLMSEAFLKCKLPISKSEHTTNVKSPKAEDIVIKRMTMPIAINSRFLANLRGT